MNEEDGWNNEGRGKISFPPWFFFHSFILALSCIFVLLPRVKSYWFVSDLYTFVSFSLFLVGI